MAFTFTIGSKTFAPRSPGVSVNNALTYASPSDLFKIRPGVSKNGVLSAGISRVFEKDVTSSAGTTRVQATVSLNINVPSNGSFTQEEIDVLISDINTAVSPEVVTRVLQGES